LEALFRLSETKGGFVMALLRRRMLEDLQFRNDSPTSVRIYLHAITEFARRSSIPPDQLDVEHIRQYQIFLIKEKKVFTADFRSGGLRFSFLLHPHTPPENHYRPHSVFAARTEAAVDFERR
jgi:hypothetical protein